MAPDYAFRPMTSADLDLIGRWLATAHVREWWGDPDEQYAQINGRQGQPAASSSVAVGTIATGPSGHSLMWNGSQWQEARQ